MKKYARVIKALQSAIFEAEEEHEKINMRYNYQRSKSDIEEYDALIKEYKEAIIILGCYCN